MEISRDEWLKEIEAQSPSPKDFEADVAIERFVVHEGALKVAYRRNERGESHYASFSGSAEHHVSVLQIYGGHCYLQWKWRKNIPGLPPDKHDAVNAALEEFRNTLGGSAEKAWEPVSVADLGVEQVQAALRKVSYELVAILKTA